MIKTIRLKVKPEARPWLNKAASEVNQVWNWANETTSSRVRNGLSSPSGFDLDRMASGSSRCLPHLMADSVQQIFRQYEKSRRKQHKVKLRWRVSSGPRRSLGWVPFKAVNLKIKGNAVRYYGKTFRVFDLDYLKSFPKHRAGCFAQNALGEWYLCVSVDVERRDAPATHESVGIDLGLKDTATTSDGETLPAGHYYRELQPKIAQAQRRGHKKQAKRLHQKAANKRRDALHKFSRKIVDNYQHVVIGDVSSAKLKRTKMAKSVSDAGWYMLKRMIEYKGEHAARTVEVVNEAYTTRTCSNCGALSGPKGLDMLVVREWACGDCGASHNRDVNAARNILALRQPASVCGNERLVA